MKSFCFILSITFIVFINKAFGSEAGMPQLNPEYWAAQVFWLILIFTSLYLIIWKIFLPKLTYSIENRKSRVVNDLDEAQKLKEKAEIKLNEHDKIIENSKKEAKKIIEEEKKKLNQDIEEKKKKFSNEIEKEIANIEEEIKNFKKSSVSNINKIAAETAAEIIKQTVDTEVNKSNVVAIVEDITKRKLNKYI